MTDAKIREVLDRYERTVDGRPGPGFAHVRTMIPAMRAMLDEMHPYRSYLSGEWEKDVPDIIGLSESVAAYGARREKLMRWLGFVQGVFYDRGIYTVDEMRAHNRPDGEVFR